MELKQKYLKDKSNQMQHNQIEKEMESLKYIVNDVFKLNIMKASRTRELVDARLVYSKILRDRGHTFKSIGDSISKDHTTIVHYISTSNFVLKHYSALTEKYIICKDILAKDSPFFSDQTNTINLAMKIFNLNLKIDELMIERNNILKANEKYKRLKSIIDMIDFRTSDGDELIMQDKINKMLNERAR